MSLNPTPRRTWAPKGASPVLRVRWRNWKTLSMAGLLAYKPGRAKILFHARPGSYTDETLIEVIRELHRHLPGKVTLIWDGLASHRSRRMKTFLSSQRRWLVVEPLPPYAYDLNPCEGLWSNLKGRELANFCPETIEDCERAARSGIGRIRRDETLAFSFLRRTGLSL